MKVFVSLVLLVLVGLRAPAAAAPAADSARADQLFREARALMKQGNFAVACLKLVESQRLDPAPGTAVNLADCWERNGKLADAASAHRTALALLPRGDSRIALVQRSLAALERRVARLSLVVGEGVPARATVQRDGTDVPASELGRAIAVNAGSHDIVLVGPEGSQRRWTVQLRDGEHRSLVLRFDGERMGAAAGPQRPAASSARTVGYVLGGVGFVGLVFGAWQYARFGSKSDDYAAVCAGRESNCPSAERARADSLKEEADTAGTLSAVGLIGGALVLGAGGVLVWTGKTGGNAAGAWRFAPSVGRSQVSVGAGTSW